MTKNIEKPQDQESKQQFAIQRLYIKEKTCKLNNAPQLFSQEWKPEISMEMQVKPSPQQDDLYEVVLHINISAKNNHITAFTAEIQQAGIFVLKGFTKDQNQQILMTHAPNILFPYARKVIADMSIEATLPPIVLQPIDFTAIYMQQQANQNKTEEKPDVFTTEVTETKQ